MMADKARGAAQRLHHGFAPVLLVNADKHLRVAKIARHIHMRDGKHAVGAGVGDLLADNPLHLAHDFRRNAVSALKLL